MKTLLKDKQKEFLLHIEKIKGYSDLTIKSYDESLNEAFEYIEIIEGKKHTILNLMPYRIKISSLNSKTISKKLSAIRSFVKFLNEAGLKITLKANQSIKVPKTLPKPISNDYILEALQDTSSQERVLITLLYTLGLRISELSNLEIKDISDEWVRIVGKGNKQRDIPLLKSTKELIDEYLTKYPKKRYIFEEKGEKLSQNSLRYMITKVFKKVGLKVTPHQLRHSYATELLNNNAPIADVSELLGHSSMATTQIYTKLGSMLKKQNYHAAHPLCGEKTGD